MASSPTDPAARTSVERFVSFDGTSLGYRVLGEGPVVVLIHGLFSNAEVNWIRPGTAAAIAEAGYRVVMPDLRGHGVNNELAPGPLPPDVLALDAAALVEQLGEAGELVIGGYSLGGRTTLRLLARGVRPRRAIVAGMGLRGVTDGGRSTDWFLDAIARRDEIKPGDDQYLAVQFMRTTRVNPEVAAAVLRAHVDTPEQVLRALPTPTLVVCGAKDEYRKDAEALAGVLPAARFVETPGTHMSAVADPALGRAIVVFLTGRAGLSGAGLPR